MPEFDLFGYTQVLYANGMIEAEKALLASMLSADASAVRSMGYAKHTPEEYKLLSDRIAAWANDINEIGRARG